MRRHGGPEPRNPIGSISGPRQHLADDFQQVGAAHRLDHPTGGAEFFGLVAAGLLAFRGQHQNRREAEPGRGPRLADEFDAVHVRHVDVRDDEVGLGCRRQPLQSLQAVAGGHHGEAGQLQIVFQAEHHRARVVHHQYRFCHLIPLVDSVPRAASAPAVRWRARPVPAARPPSAPAGRRHAPDRSRPGRSRARPPAARAAGFPRPRPSVRRHRQVCRRSVSCSLQQLPWIQDHQHRAVAHQRRTGIRGQPGQHATHRLEDHLHHVLEVVHHHADVLAIDAQHQHR
ncbi:conserved hypothetical protein, partial [Ricinus communis]